jgi:hypothetical protein
MNEMFTPLTAQEIAHAENITPSVVNKLPIIPVPHEAPPMSFEHPKLGLPVKTWPYHDSKGRLVGYVARFEYVDDAGHPAKDYRPITYCDLGKGRRGWRAKGIPDPRPLYRLPDMISRVNAPVIVTEGEKAADAAAILFPDMVVTTPPHGAK